MKGWFGWNLFKNWVLLNLTPTSTQLSATPSVLLEPKYRICRKFQICPFWLNIGTWYHGGTDSASGLRFLKFRPQNPFLGKFGPKKSKLSVLPENWHIWCLEYVDSYSDINFLSLQPEIHFWVKKFKIIRFAWKLAHMVSLKSWFRIRT